MREMMTIHTAQILRERAVQFLIYVAVLLISAVFIWILADLARGGIARTFPRIPDGISARCRTGRRHCIHTGFHAAHLAGGIADGRTGRMDDRDIAGGVCTG